MSPNISKMCRTCLISDAPLLHLFDNCEENRKTTSVVEMLQSISSIKISSSDGLPNSICICCISEINRSYLFKIKCETSDKTLLQLLLKDKQKENIQFDKMTKKLFEVELSKEENNFVDKLVSDVEINSDERIVFIENPVATTQNDRSDEELLDYVNSSTKIFENIDEVNTTTIKSIVSGFLKDNCEQEQENSQIYSECLETSKGFSILKRIKDKIKCPDCPQEFIHKKNLNKHMLKHLEVGKVIRTGLHEERNKSNQLLDNKAEQMLGKKMIENEKNVSDMEECILKHKTFQNSDYAYKCKQCGAGFRLEKSLDFHSKLNRCTQKQFECCVCKKVFISKNNLILHMDSHKKYFECRKCAKSFEFEEALKEHLNNDHSGNNIKNQCPICGKSFSMLSALKDHQRIHSGEKPFLCSVCGKSFTQNTNLKQHVMRHSKIKPFKCEQCYCSFVSKGELNSHIRKHTGEHPFVCDTCGSRFTTSSSLLKHKRIHTGERPYACDYCPMRFAALGTMKNHQRTHTGEKPFVCKICKRGFSQQSDCVTHMRTHTGERPYICPICGLCFQQSGTMKTHYKKLHTSSRADSTKL